VSKIYLNAGDLIITKEGAILCTVLGSCVSVCVFDPIKKVGGMNHFLLPEPNESSSYHDPLMFGLFAIPALFKEFKKMGSKPTDLIIKILGGANSTVDSVTPIHQENVKIARKVIQDLGLKIAAESVGGTEGRKIEFCTSTGEVRYGFTTNERSVPTLNPARLASIRDQKVRVMIVDDSVSVRLFLKKLLQADPNIEVVCECEDASLAESLREKFKPDVITLDLHMPILDGLSYIRKVMPVNPIPIILVSDCSINEGKTVISALESGAFDYTQKPSFSQMETVGGQLRSQIHAAFQHLKSGHFKPKLELSKTPQAGAINSYSFSDEAIKNGLIAIGASTGGTEAIRAVLTSLPEKIPATVIVQHMPSNFTASFANRLNELCPFNVHEAKDNEILQPSTVYIAPGGMHLQVIVKQGIIHTKLSELPDNTLFKPSVDVLFKSVAQLRAKPILAVLLTGMGKDGAEGLLELKHKGATTFAQNEESCVVFGMPKAAIDLGAATYISPLSELALKMVQTTK
jgi:chemotaxis response regulator CheB/chemotaxis receptor (MCP) glutamine deamidase CheD